MENHSEIKDFIKHVLGDIVMAVRESQPMAAANEAAINPVGLNFNPASASITTYNDAGNISTIIDFDIALFVETSKSRTGKLNVGVLKIGAGGERGSSTTDTITHRVKFKVPILLPGQASK